MNDLDEGKISKRNRRKRLEAEEGAPITHLPILNMERETPRKVRDRKLNLLVKRARKKKLVGRPL